MPSGAYSHTYWLGRKHTEKTRAKMSANKVGKVSNAKGKHWKCKKREGWIYKVSREKAYDTKYKYWMLEVKKRDNWKCKINNEDCDGRIESHHILDWRSYPELRYNINNGITLCQAHHPRKRAEEKELQDYFKNLVQVSNAKNWKY